MRQDPDLKTKSHCTHQASLGNKGAGKRATHFVSWCMASMVSWSRFLVSGSHARHSFTVTPLSNSSRQPRPLSSPSLPFSPTFQMWALLVSLETWVDENGLDPATTFFWVRRPCLL